MATAVWKKINAGEIDSVYLLTGPEQHLIDETISRLKKSILPLDGEDVIRFDLEETPVEMVIEEADTIPFLADRKLIIAGNANFLKAQDKAREKVAHNVEMLAAWLKDPSPTSTVVFVAPYEKLDGRKTITKLMKETATVVEAERIQGKDLFTWVQQEAGSHGVRITLEAAEYLVKMGGDDLLSLSSEISKMAMYLGQSGNITETIIEELVPRTPEMDVFRLTDAYISGKTADAVLIYNDLLRSGEEPIMLTSLIASQIRLMIHVGTLRKKGYPQHQIAKTVNVHPYRVKLVMENRNIPHAERLLSVLDQLAGIDHQLKTSSGRRERILELFLMAPLKR
ncbi:DNA-directed DNA polymerase III delta subunit [Bacillus sp. OxB-1]|uniref:DNA polymerase III subunit delta n=1 Tax=Bacillus sp. (strain OxB-1) TaxID=98228 RepID=UPI0005821208|nr:DNA polymerase III subunit delta [Bacillus sp. OxB-1]BAQ11505.1 DNA-directed DNA polymerase III delta subunit [Bacillus sp. OxB-1]